MVVVRGLVAGLIALQLGCTPTPSEPQRADMALQEAVAGCTAAHGYDPRAADLPEHALAPGEREWRDCARAAVSTGIVPKSSVPDLYRRLLADDERMTDALAAGAMSRTERTQRLEASIEGIRAAETRASEEQRAQLLRDAQRQAELQRRNDEVRRITAQAAQTQRIMIGR